MKPLYSSEFPVQLDLDWPRPIDKEGPRWRRKPPKTGTVVVTLTRGRGKKDLLTFVTETRHRNPFGGEVVYPFWFPASFAEKYSQILRKIARRLEKL